MGTPAHVRAWVCTCGLPLAAVGDERPERCARCGLEAGRTGRSPQPTRGNLALDHQLHSRPTGDATGDEEHP
jgi:hypothetical protein